MAPDQCRVFLLAWHGERLCARMTLLPELADDDTLYGRTEITQGEISERMDAIRNELDDLKQLDDYSCDTYYRTDTINAAWAREYANEIGAIKAFGLEWPYTHIDWEAAANELKQDFVEVTFGDETYFGR